MWMKEEIAPRRFGSVCSLMAALVWRNEIQENSYRQKMDRAGIESVHRFVEINGQRLVGIQPSCDADLDLGEL